MSFNFNNLQYINEGNNLNEGSDQKELIKKLKPLIKQISSLYSNAEGSMRVLYYLPQQIGEEIVELINDPDTWSTSRETDSIAQILWINSTPKERKDLYNKYKYIYDKHFDSKIRECKRQYPTIIKYMKEYISKFEEVLKLIKDNHESYQSIKKKWYQILGGIKGDVKRYESSYNAYKKISKLNAQTFITSFLQIEFLKGGNWNKTLDRIDEDYFSEHFWSHLMWEY